MCNFFIINNINVIIRAYVFVVMSLKVKKFFVSIICVLCLCVMYGCQNKNIFNMALNNIAEVRELMFVGETNNINVSLISGHREQDYVVNGYSTDLIEFGVLTFQILSNNIMPQTVNYVLTIGTTRYDGVLEHNPYNDTYVCDIQKAVKTGQTIYAKIIAGEFVESVELFLVTTNWVLDYKDALKTACSELNNELKSFVVNEQFCGECYIKILNDNELTNTYYWYVNFVSRDGKNYAVIVDPITAEILAKKTI